MAVEPETGKEALAEAMRGDIAAVIVLREENARDASLHETLLRLKAWQAARLARTYADLLASERYRPATTFFLDDLYGPKDFRSRDEQLARVVPLMTSILPAGALKTIAAAVKLDLLSESLDRDVARALPAGGSGIDEASYAAAYRAAGRPVDRERQIVLTGEIGAALDELTPSRSLRGALVLMRKPARVAGLGVLQEFLERGFNAFRHMHGAREFLDTVTGRERDVMRRLYAGDPHPFERGSVPV